MENLDKERKEFQKLISENNDFERFGIYRTTMFKKEHLKEFGFKTKLEKNTRLLLLKMMKEQIGAIVVKIKESKKEINSKNLKEEISKRV